MNKSELIDAVANAADMTKADATKAVDAFIGVVTDALKEDDQVTLVGFGTTPIPYRWLTLAWNWGYVYQPY